MPSFDLLILIVAGLAAGLSNALAGGGTFFTFSALVATGLPPIAANATSAVGVTPGNLTSVLSYAPELRLHAPRFFSLLVMSAIGSVLGALLLLAIDNAQFRAAVPWLILFATLLFAFGPALNRMIRREAGVHHKPHRGISRVIQFFVGIYGGFFGAAMGFMMLAGLSLTENEDFHVLNALKILMASIIQLVSVTVFVVSGLVSWPQCLAIMVPAMVGGWVGVRVGRKVPAWFTRAFVIATGLTLSAVFFWRG